MVMQWVKNIVENNMEHSKLTIGKTIKHPDGRTVKITDGQFWGTHGVSNFWYWREVLKNGELAEIVENGYGW